MAAAPSVVLHQEGHGQKLMKTKLHVLGRFLLRPDEEFNAVVARQLVDKARQRRVKVSTELRVFDRGIQIGDYGVFASMPIEFIKYHRLSDLTVLTNEPNLLVICVKDYEQKCVTVMRFKDATVVKVVTDVVHKHRTAYMEEYAKMSEVGSTLRRTAGAGAQQNGSAAAASSSVPPDRLDGPSRERQREPDYMVIRKRQGAAGASSHPQPPPPPAKTTVVWQGNRVTDSPERGSFFTKITVPGESESSMHQQYQLRRSQLLAQKKASATNRVSSGGDGDGLDELEMAAVFETLDGPPTVLNEPARYVSRVTDGQLATEFGGESRSQTQWRLAERSHHYSSGSAVAASRGGTGSHTRAVAQ